MFNQNIRKEIYHSLQGIYQKSMEQEQLNVALRAIAMLLKHYGEEGPEVEAQPPQPAEPLQSVQDIKTAIQALPDQDVKKLRKSFFERSRQQKSDEPDSQPIFQQIYEDVSKEMLDQQCQDAILLKGPVSSALLSTEKSTDEGSSAESPEKSKGTDKSAERASP